VRILESTTDVGLHLWASAAVAEIAKEGE